jgi:tripartite-type tricarboxylate transporter receptor subunit TctC
VPIIFDNLPSALPHIQAGRLVAVAVATPTAGGRFTQRPDLQRTGLGCGQSACALRHLGAQGHAPALVAQLNQAIRQVLQDPAVIKRIEATGSKVVANSPAQFAAQLKDEYLLYKKVVDDQKLKLD